MKKAIRPVFQPILDTEHNRLLHYEALARSRAPNSLNHVQLIKAGEEAGFVELIDIAMMEQVGHLMLLEPDIRVAVNVSGYTVDCASGDYLAALMRFLSLGPRLIFEITETHEIADQEALERFLKVIRSTGACIALDDFGTGAFCSLDVVQSMRPEFIKIAREVISEVKVTGDAGLIRDVQKVAKGYGGALIAEGIESYRTYQMVRELGIPYMQGFYFGRTYPALINVRGMPLVEEAKRRDEARVVFVA